MWICKNCNSEDKIIPGGIKPIFNKNGHIEEYDCDYYECSVCEEWGHELNDLATWED